MPAQSKLCIHTWTSCVPSKWAGFPGMTPERPLLETILKSRAFR